MPSLPEQPLGLYIGQNCDSLFFSITKGTDSFNSTQYKLIISFGQPFLPSACSDHTPSQSYYFQNIRQKRRCGSLRVAPVATKSDVELCHVVLTATSSSIAHRHLTCRCCYSHIDPQLQWRLVKLVITLWFIYYLSPINPLCHWR